jgi:hypothetical protein
MIELPLARIDVSAERRPASAPTVEPTAALASMKVAELKLEAKLRGLKVGGKKGDLAARIAAHDQRQTQHAARTESVTESVPEAETDVATPSATESEDAAFAASVPEELATLTILELKARLRAAKLKLGGSKQELINRCLDNGLQVQQGGSNGK